MNVEDFLKLVSIPAETFCEEERAHYIADKFKDFGNICVITDEVNNVIVIPDGLKTPAVLVSAHLDTVFADKYIDIVRENGNIMAPGAGDDTANVYVLLCVLTDMLEKNEFPENVIVAFNSCEEGKGNLIGINRVLDRLSGKISAHIAFDLTYNHIINRALGSVRYEVKISTRGGHSFNAFGVPNAIAVASKIISEIYDIDVSNHECTTYNVGLIEGGISVNTIADSVRFLYEVRSASYKNMKDIDSTIHKIIDKFSGDEVEIKVKETGRRPCGGDGIKEEIDALTKICENAVSLYAKMPTYSIGSTDCNASVARNIPAVCVGCYNGGGEHTYNEWVEESSIYTGYDICKKIIEDVSKYIKRHEVPFL